MNKKIIIISSIIVVIFIVIGFYGAKVVLNRELKNNSVNNNLEVSFPSVNDVITDLPKEFQSKKVSGRIKEINEQGFVLKIEPDSLIFSELDERIVEVNENTKIYRLVLKDQEKMREELENYSKNIKNAPSESEDKLLAMPDMFIKQEISLQDIKAGEQATITAENDIYTEKQFFAVEISVAAESLMKDSAGNSR